MQKIFSIKIDAHRADRSKHGASMQSEWYAAHVDSVKRAARVNGSNCGSKRNNSILIAIFWRLLVMTGCMGVAQGKVETTIYVNKYFEVRQNEAPTKYVWNDSTRVAQVTGSLSENKRVQRLRLSRGWNLCSVAVSVTNGFQHIMGPDSDKPISIAYRWDPGRDRWDQLLPNSKINADSVVWIHAIRDVTVPIFGSYSDPTGRVLVKPTNFIPSAGLEAWDVQSSIAGLGFVSGWTYNSVSAQWFVRLASSFGFVSDFPESIPPGGAVFVQGLVGGLQVPAAELRIRYYHQDHLSSSSVLSDGLGSSVQEITYYPFGQARTVSPSASNLNPYLFSQKESDLESRLYSFDCRYYVPTCGRFASLDPLIVSPSSARARHPQKFGAYAYCENRPSVFFDPDGCDDLPVQTLTTQNFSANSTKSPVATVDQAALCHRDFDLPVLSGVFPARHCFMTEAKAGEQLPKALVNGKATILSIPQKNTLTYDNKTSGTFDSNPGWTKWPTCGPAQSVKAGCLEAKYKQLCDPANYNLATFNCCTCALKAMEACGMSANPEEFPKTNQGTGLPDSLGSGWKKSLLNGINDAIREISFQADNFFGIPR